jgi:hypothetical protein
MTDSNTLARKLRLPPFVDDPFRVVRTDRIPIGRTSAFVEVVERTSRGPMRALGRRRGKRPGSLYYSVKNGGLHGYESRGELLGFWFCETDPATVSFREQPHTLRVAYADWEWHYTPDREDDQGRRGLRVVEVKAETIGAGADYAAKLDLAATIYSYWGIRFEVQTRAELEREPRLSAIEEIQAYRRVAFTSRDVALARKFLSSGSTTIGALDRALNTDGNGGGQAKICAMQVAGIVEVDTSSPLKPTSFVALAML